MAAAAAAVYIAAASGKERKGRYRPGVYIPIVVVGDAPCEGRRAPSCRPGGGHAMRGWRGARPRKTSEEGLGESK